MALSLLPARCGSGAGAGLALAWQWLLPGTREKYLSRESLPRVSRLYCHASRLLAGATPPRALLASVSALPTSSHSQRPHHRLPLPSRPSATATPAAPPVAALADTARSAPCSDKAWVPRYVHACPRRSSQEAGHGHRSSTLGGTYLWTACSGPVTVSRPHPSTTSLLTLSTSHEALLGFTSHEAWSHAALQPGSAY